MSVTVPRPARDLRAPLNDLIDDHGLIRVSLALMRAVLGRGKNRAPPLDGLSPHLKRDIGLEPDRRGPTNYWDLR
ncbi:hypothetical protein [Paracoccus aestuariivivens]|uniref:DUF1127 domain-containing protein n=1 Tax=Paracoccus aestuariivivens TaxID=1820333 RepID=A0A6L6JAS5_9RHOB|nr:hypothetical protein [Paracoccus aestuariivivens]MTH78646.1 hypothetical protein [Paracoccus aestuariivivens]